MFHLVVDICDHSIPADCCANSDQTGYTYSQPRLSTYNLTGMSQVMIIGKEDKQSFMIMASVSMSGEALPFQVMYVGMTATSLPDLDDPKSKFKAMNNEAKQLRFCFEFT